MIFDRNDNDSGMKAQSSFAIMDLKKNCSEGMKNHSFSVNQNFVSNGTICGTEMMRL